MLEEKKDDKENVKKKIDRVLAQKPVEEPEDEEDKDKPTIWSPFARKIYADMKLYLNKVGDGTPTRAVSTKFRNDIDEKLEAGKEKDNLVKWYNKKFKLPGVSTLPWNYFAETVINFNEKQQAEKKLLDGIEEILDDAINVQREPGPENTLKVLAKNILDFIKKSEKKDPILSENHEEGLIKHWKSMAQKYYNDPHWKQVIDYYYDVKTGKLKSPVINKEPISNFSK